MASRPLHTDPPPARSAYPSQIPSPRARLRQGLEGRTDPFAPGPSPAGMARRPPFTPILRQSGVPTLLRSLRPGPVSGRDSRDEQIPSPRARRRQGRPVGPFTQILRQPGVPTLLRSLRPGPVSGRDSRDEQIPSPRARRRQGWPSSISQPRAASICSDTSCLHSHQSGAQLLNCLPHSGSVSS